MAVAVPALKFPCVQGWSRQTVDGSLKHFQILFLKAQTKNADMLPCHELGQASFLLGCALTIVERQHSAAAELHTLRMKQKPKVCKLFFQRGQRHEILIWGSHSVTVHVPSAPPAPPAVPRTAAHVESVFVKNPTQITTFPELLMLLECLILECSTAWFLQTIGLWATVGSRCFSFMFLINFYSNFWVTLRGSFSAVSKQASKVEQAEFCK